MQPLGCLALFLFSAAVLCFDTAQTEKVETAATNQLKGLYKVLHDVALPGSDFDLTIPKKQCLALMLPGKGTKQNRLLSWATLCSELETQDLSAKIVDISLCVQQRMFQLCDVVSVSFIKMYLGQWTLEGLMICQMRRKRGTNNH